MAEEETEAHDWSAYWDADGNLYYYNSVTGESAWEAPEKFNPPPAKEGDAPAAADTAGDDAQPQPEAAGGAGTWTAHKTDDGQEYFYNADTGETTWEKPEGVIISETEADVSPQRQESPSAAAIPMDVDEETIAADEKQEQASVEEEKEEAEVEVDPAVKAEQALKEPDAIMERGMCYGWETD